MKTLKDYSYHLLAQGKYFFSKKDALHDLGISESQLRSQAYRATKKGNLKRLTNDFFMIISPEYSNLGSLPPHWVVDALMRHLEQEYYIGLLSAAALYGATDQQPMAFQVITTKSTKNIKLERVDIEFHVFKHCLAASKSNIQVPTGYAKVSTREQTIVDLVRFYEVSGYLSNVAVVIKALSEELDIMRFADVIQNEKTKSILQRLGYICQLLSLPKLAEIIENELANKKIEYRLLRPDFHGKDGTRDTRWKIIVNDTVELR